VARSSDDIVVLRNVDGEVIAEVAGTHGVSMPGRDLTGVDLTGMELTGWNLDEADLTGAKLTATRLIDCSLRGATLVRACLDAGGEAFGFATATFERCDLSGADMRWSFGCPRFDDASLAASKLEGATYSGGATRFTRCDFRGVRAHGLHLRCLASLVDCRFDDSSDLSGSAFYLASIEEHSEVAGPVLAGADLRGSDLRSAHLERINLEGARLEGAIYDRFTQFRSGFDPAAAGMELVEPADPWWVGGAT
jgi:uncharacterized protein YjbI with pentapeptide repeats